MMSLEFDGLRRGPIKCYCIRWFPIGEVSELADEHDLGSCAERRGGSSPPFPTNSKFAEELSKSWHLDPNSNVTGHPLRQQTLIL